MKTPLITVKIQAPEARTRAQKKFTYGNQFNYSLLLKTPVMERPATRWCGKLIGQWFFIPFSSGDLLIHKSRTDLIETEQKP